MRSLSTPRRIPFLVGAVVLAAAFVAVYLIFVTTHLGQVIDERALDGAGAWRGGLIDAARWLLAALPALSIGVALVIVVVVVLVRHNGTVLAVAISAALAANASTQLLKYLVLSRPDRGVAEGLSNSLPSGHTTAAASAALVVFLVSSPRMRPLVAVLGSAFAVTAGAATLVNQWHRPSDVIAALLVVGFWGCAAGFMLATVSSARATRQSGIRLRWLASLAIVCAVAAGVGFAVTLSNASNDTSHLFIAYAGGVAAIAAVGAALAWAGTRMFRWLR